MNLTRHDNLGNYNNEKHVRASISLIFFIYSFFVGDLIHSLCLRGLLLRFNVLNKIWPFVIVMLPYNVYHFH